MKKSLNIPVTITEAHMIEAIGKQDGEENSIGNIASLLNIAAPTATVAVKKLENKGVIKKVPCGKDARRMIISLTELGKKIEKAHHVFHAKMVRAISKKFIDAEKEIILRVTELLMEFFAEEIKITEGV
jgi:DNA-binding MarR family transcriptional regulator